MSTTADFLELEKMYILYIVWDVARTCGMQGRVVVDQAKIVGDIGYVGSHIS
jgi:hypothetical protein